MDFHKILEKGHALIERKTG